MKLGLLAVTSFVMELVQFDYTAGRHDITVSGRRFRRPFREITARKLSADWLCCKYQGLPFHALFQQMASVRPRPLRRS